MEGKNLSITLFIFSFIVFVIITIDTFFINIFSDAIYPVVKDYWMLYLIILTIVYVVSINIMFLTIKYLICEK